MECTAPNLQVLFSAWQHKKCRERDGKLLYFNSKPETNQISEIDQKRTKINFFWNLETDQKYVAMDHSKKQETF